jgi:hypothetical protein
MMQGYRHRASIVGSAGPMPLKGLFSGIPHQFDPIDKDENKT